MAGKRRGNQKSLFATLAFIIAIIAVVFGRFNKSFDSVNIAPENMGEVPAVHFVDVGQGSCILLQSKKDGVLIDAGEKEYGETVVHYLKSCGIEKLSYVIATHPHTDHIGGLATVLKALMLKTLLCQSFRHQIHRQQKHIKGFLKQLLQKKSNPLPQNPEASTQPMKYLLRFSARQPRATI